MALLVLFSFWAAFRCAKALLTWAARAIEEERLDKIARRENRRELPVLCDNRDGETVAERRNTIAQAVARIDTEEINQRINALDLLMDAAQAKYYNAATDTEEEQALRRIISLRRQIATAEKQLARAQVKLSA